MTDELIAVGGEDGVFLEHFEVGLETKCDSCNTRIRFTIPSYNMFKNKVIDVYWCLRCMEKNSPGKKAELIRPSQKVLKELRTVLPNFSEKEYRKIRDDIKNA